MAREHAQIFVRVWGDPDWRSRTTAEQQLYFLLVSQPQMNFAGVLPLQPRKWASCSTDGDQLVQDALAGLRRHRYVVVDEDTEEVLVRTFIRNSEVYRIPGVLKAALAAAAAAQSQTIRAVLAEELGRLPSLEGKTAAEMTARIAATRALLRPTGEPIRERFAEPIGDASRNPSGNGSSAVRKEPIPGPIGEPIAEPSITGPVTRSSAVDTVNDLERGNVQEADARADAVPDTAPAPLEEPDPEDDERAYDEFVAAARRAQAPAVASPIEGAMPPRRCRNHLAKPDDWDGNCGKCADARRAQQAWIADRGAKVEQARAEAQAEIAEERRLERAAIDRCVYCDDRGVTPHGVRCAHTGPVDQMPPGRAAAKRAVAELAERRERRKGTGPASGEQLQRLAIAFGQHGNTDRDARIDWCNANLPARPEPITSTTELTVAEASALIDVLDAEPPGDAEALEDYRAAVAVNAAMGEPDPDPDVEPDDGTESEPDGDPDVEGEYLADQATWTTDDEPAAAYSYAGGPDEPPF